MFSRKLTEGPTDKRTVERNRKVSELQNVPFTLERRKKVGSLGGLNACLERMNSMPKPLATTRSHAFSRALRQLPVITSSFGWFTVLSVSLVTG